MEAIISLISSVFELLVSVSAFFSKRIKRSGKKVKKFTWQEIELGVVMLSRKIAQDFEPEVIMCSSTGASGIVANLYFLTNDKFIPILWGNHRPIKSKFTIPVEENRKLFFNTRKWAVYLPDELEKYKDKKILIIEDVVLSGDSLEKELEVVSQCGYKPENIKTALVFISTVALYSNKKPDYYWYQLDDAYEYYYPWSRSIFGKGYDK